MIVTQQKTIPEISDSLKGCKKIFLVGCGECATTCKTGGKNEIEEMKKQLESRGFIVVGSCVPDAPCVAAQIKTEYAKQMKALREAEAIVVLSCGLGVQSAKDNDRLGLFVVPACNSLFGAVVDAQGSFIEKCSLCGACVLQDTAAICPVTLCAKGLLNGPCGGADKGKCEADKDKDCAWILIYRELEKKNLLERLKVIQPPKDHKKTAKPRKISVQ
ncbi:MAG: methylenetetrahydrofolate reductase C-terminal domain-containing protein [Candidatus Omnitrophota bacterium]|jgi:ferredoxin